MCPTVGYATVVREGETISAARKRRTEAAETPMIPWRVLLPMSGGFFFITAVLLWFGAVIAVRCDRTADGRVDVTAEQRVLGLVAVRSERLVDVVRALVVQKTGGVRRGNSGRAGPQLQLTLRDGREWESMPAANHIVGTSPIAMAKRIQDFLDQPSATSLEMKWIPWLMLTLAVPFILFSALFAMAIVNTLRRQRGTAS